MIATLRMEADTPESRGAAACSDGPAEAEEPCWPARPLAGSRPVNGGAGAGSVS